MVLVFSFLFLLIASSTEGAAQPETEPQPETDGPPEFLFQMVAGGATFEAGTGSFDGVLTLLDVDNQTVAFSDRPERIARPISTDDFLALFAPVDDPESNSFFADPPNAAFSCAVGTGEVFRAVFVIRAPSESRSGKVSLEVESLYLSHHGAWQECDGPAVRSTTFVPTTCVRDFFSM